MSSMNQNNIINPKDCSYRCSTRIYWNPQENVYWEILSKKKHMYVRIGLIKLLPRIIILVILVTLIVHFITKNPFGKQTKNF
jgi:hypothetical protein